VHLLTIETAKHTNKIEIIPDQYRSKLNITGVPEKIHISTIKLLINFLFSSKAYIATRFYSQRFLKEILKLINENHFDFIQLEGLYSLQYINDIRKKYRGKLIYRSHNIEYQIWSRNAVETKNLLKKLYFKNLSRRLKKLEKKFLNSYDFILPISQTDASCYMQLGNQKPLLVAPFGIEINQQNNNVTLKTDQSINFIGALDWIPNQNGIIWFIKNCFPAILKRYPDIKLKLAGRNAPAWFTKKLNHPNIDYLGQIENINDFYQLPGPFIVPLFSGSGMRVKIIEAMTYKKAIITTRLGAEGIDATNNENIVIANSNLEFIDDIIKLLSNQELQNNIGQNAFGFVKENYDFSSIAKQVLTFIQ
jgi:glycosyltransferase involved in cell wall biosynthesis